jgi:hypothetical protein
MQETNQVPQEASQEVPTLANEIKKEEEPKKVEITEDLVYKTIIKRAVKDGWKFKDEAEALAWAKRRFETLYKRELKRGYAVRCTVCGKPGSNAQTGPLIKSGKDNYVHKNCKS